ncbi:MAG: NUDIX domain-containing protein [Bacteroidales bacterium]|nr:NUDIX domain-containing protein [Bacteroidales bacterium]
MIEVKIHPTGKDLGQYLFVVIAARYRGKWVWVKHRDRDTWEIPGGHIEKDESADDAASRELIEETGAITFKLKVICDYSVKKDGKEGISRLYLAYINEIGPLPESEICCVDFFDTIPKNLTYPDIQPILFKEVSSNGSIA